MVGTSDGPHTATTGVQEPLLSNGGAQELSEISSPGPSATTSAGAAGAAGAAAQQGGGGAAAAPANPARWGDQAGLHHALTQFYATHAPGKEREVDLGRQAESYCSNPTKLAEAYEVFQERYGARPQWLPPLSPMQATAMSNASAAYHAKKNGQQQPRPPQQQPQQQQQQQQPPQLPRQLPRQPPQHQRQGGGGAGMVVSGVVRNGTTVTVPQFHQGVATGFGSRTTAMTTAMATLRARHPPNDDCVAHIYQAGPEVQNSALQARLNAETDYQRLTSAFTLDGESVVGGPELMLQYDQITMTARKGFPANAPANLAQAAPTLTRGCLVLTDRRLLSLTSEPFFQGMLQQNGGRYTAKYASRDHFAYHPFNLSQFKHVEFDMHLGAEASVDVRPGPPPVQSSCCCAPTAIMKYLKGAPRLQKTSARHINIYLENGPYSFAPTIIMTIVLAPTEPYEKVRDFVIQLQRHAPHLHVAGPAAAANNNNGMGR